MKIPNFLIVGAAKSGTTSLHYYFNEHPEVFMPRCKETHFFSELVELCNKNKKGGLYGRGRLKDLNKYSSQFEQAGKEKALGEACVSYLYFYEVTIPKIQSILSDPKIIIILRDPVERSFSNYMHHVRDGFEKLSFLDAVKNASERRKNNWWWGYQYIEASLYADSVRAYMDSFTEVKVVFFDKLKNEPTRLMQELYEFVGVKRSFTPDVEKKYNRAETPRYPCIARARKNSTLAWRFLKFCDMHGIAKPITKILTSKTNAHSSLTQYERSVLAPYFKDDILALEKILRTDLRAWRQDV